MAKVVIREGRKADSKQLIDLVLGLAKFENLRPPSAAGRRRLLEDVFEKKRLKLLVAAVGKNLIGYAIYFYTYSSFLAKPTLYIEDLFIIGEHRGRGVGFALFRRCIDEAVSEGCGRMEWAVLDWNEKAQHFYEKLGARRLTEWHTYRLDEASLRRVPRRLER